LFQVSNPLFAKGNVIVLRQPGAEKEAAQKGESNTVFEQYADLVIVRIQDLPLIAQHRAPALAAQRSHLLIQRGIHYIVCSREIKDLARLNAQYFLCLVFIGKYTDVFAQFEHLLLAEHHEIFIRIINTKRSSQGKHLTFKQILLKLKNGIHSFSG
jgi:hypothetical protein